MNSKPTQCVRVISYMREFGSITQLEALRDLGVMRLASRISEIKKNPDIYNVRIKDKMQTVKNRYGENCSIKCYSLAE